MFVVMRYAVLMEDEGRQELIKCFETRQQAVDWITNQAGKYFGPSDYHILTEE